jgi:signal peptidase II
VGNAIDRVVAGRVTDFFATTFVDFAVFNVADVFITCGVVASFVLWARWDSARERAGAVGK